MLSYNLFLYVEIDAASPNRTKLTFHHNFYYLNMFNLRYETSFDI